MSNPPPQDPGGDATRPWPTGPSGTGSQPPPTPSPSSSPPPPPPPGPPSQGSPPPPGPPSQSGPGYPSPPSGYGPPPGGGTPPGYGAPGPGGPPAKKSKAPLAIALGLVALVAVVVIAFVAVSVLGGDDEDTTTTSDPAEAELAEARQDLSDALIAGDDNEVEDLIGDNPELRNDSETLERGEPTSATLDDDGVAPATYTAEVGTGFAIEATGSGSQDVGGLVLDPDGSAVSSIDELIEPDVDGDYTVLFFSLDGDPGDIDVTVGGVTTDFLFVEDEVDGEIEAPGDIVRYEIDLDEASLYAISIDPTDTTVTVTDSSGSELSTTEVDGALQIESPTADTYQIEVAGAEDFTGSFTLGLTQVPDFVVTNLSDGADSDSEFTYIFTTAEETDTTLGRFRVEVRDGVTIRVTATPVAGADVELSIVENNTDRTPTNAAGPAEVETIDFTSEGYSRVEFQAIILNSTPDTIEITVERAG